MGTAPPADPMTDPAEEFTKRHGHHERNYRGGGIVADFVWSHGARTGKHQCTGSGSYHRLGSNRCANTGKVQTADGRWWCQVHSPAALQGRRARQDQEAARRNAAYDYQARRAAWEAAELAALPRLVQALREIAAGHNDAPAAAEEALRALPRGDKP